jgi:hypothetical protein
VAGLTIEDNLVLRGVALRAHAEMDASNNNAERR